MNNYIKQGNLQVDKELLELINNDIIPKTHINVEKFWEDFESIIEDLTPINKALLN